MANEKRINNLTERKLHIYDTADDVLIESIGKTENSIMKSIAGLMDKFNIKDGVIVNDETALNLINTLNKEIRKIIRNSTYTDKVDDYLKKFNTLDNLNKELQLEFNGIKLKKFNLNPVKTQTIKDLTSALTDFKSIDNNMVHPIKRIIFQQVTTGTTLKEAKKILTDFITGGDKKLGSIRRFVGQVARDSITQYDGLVNDIIAKEYDLNAFRYVGSLIQDSRPQCVRWIKKFKGVLPFEIIPRELEWADNNGHGLIPGTTLNNFAQNRGGYNCRHMAIPFRLEKTE